MNGALPAAGVAGAAARANTARGATAAAAMPEAAKNSWRRDSEVMKDLPGRLAMRQATTPRHRASFGCGQCDAAGCSTSQLRDAFRRKWITAGIIRRAALSDQIADPHQSGSNARSGRDAERPARAEPIGHPAH